MTKGSERAPNRSLFYALGYTPEELERPLIGVVSAYSEIVPDVYKRQLQHGAQICTGDHACIAAQPAGFDVGFGCNILCLALGQDFVAEDVYKRQVTT